jgi:hypothetical protein
MGFQLQDQCYNFALFFSLKSFAQIFQTYKKLAELLNVRSMGGVHKTGRIFFICLTWLSLTSEGIKIRFISVTFENNRHEDKNKRQKGN